jgi:hypothetical protein
MKRTQLYLPDSTWKTLDIRARQSGTSISELVRQAVGEKYGESPASRRQVMMAVVGICKDRKNLPDSITYVRQLRKGKRLRRLAF